MRSSHYNSILPQQPILLIPSRSEPISHTNRPRTRPATESPPQRPSHPDQHQRCHHLSHHRQRGRLYCQHRMFSGPMCMSICERIRSGTRVFVWRNDGCSKFERIVRRHWGRDWRDRCGWRLVEGGLCVTARARCAWTREVWVFSFVDGEEFVPVGALFGGDGDERGDMYSASREWMSN